MSDSLIELTGPAPKPGKYAKVSLFLRKRPDLSDEYFHAYWANNHVTPAFENKIFMEKVRRYNQVGFSPAGDRTLMRPGAFTILCSRVLTRFGSIMSQPKRRPSPSPTVPLYWSMMALQRSGLTASTTGKPSSVILDS